MHQSHCKIVTLQGDPFKTLFLARVSYKVSENELKKVFGEYGTIRNIRIVRDPGSGSIGENVIGNAELHLRQITWVCVY